MIDVDLWIFRGVTLLGLPFKDVWHMTIRQLTALFEHYCFYNGLIKKEDDDDGE